MSASCSVGTQLAAWLGLPTFEFAIIQVLPENEIPFQKGDQAHLQAMSKMKELMLSQGAMAAWMATKRKEFDAKPREA